MRENYRITYEDLESTIKVLSKETGKNWRLVKNNGMPYAQCQDCRISSKRKKELRDRIHDFLLGYWYANKGNTPNRGMYL